MKYYAVRNGRTPGVYDNWNECNAQVSGFPKASYKSFTDYQSAINFINGNDQVNQQVANVKSKISNNSQNNISNIVGQPLSWNFDKYTAIFVDGGFNNHTKPYAYGCVTNFTGQDLILHNKHLLSDMRIIHVSLPVGDRDVIVCEFSDVTQQNNGAELLSAIAGLRIALYYNRGGFPVRSIASDSKLIVESWSKYLKSESAEKFDPRKVEYIKELISLRKSFETISGNIVKISGDDNPADLGYHK